MLSWCISSQGREIEMKVVNLSGFIGDLTVSRGYSCWSEETS